MSVNQDQYLSMLAQLQRDGRLAQQGPLGNLNRVSAQQPIAPAAQPQYPMWQAPNPTSVPVAQSNVTTPSNLPPPGHDPFEGIGFPRSGNGPQQGGGPNVHTPLPAQPSTPNIPITNMHDLDRFGHNPVAQQRGLAAEAAAAAAMQQTPETIVTDGGGNTGGTVQPGGPGGPVPGGQTIPGGGAPVPGPTPTPAPTTTGMTPEQRAAVVAQAQGQMPFLPTNPSQFPQAYRNPFPTIGQSQGPSNIRGFNANQNSSQDNPLLRSMVESLYSHGANQDNPRNRFGADSGIVGAQTLSLPVNPNTGVTRSVLMPMQPNAPQHRPDQTFLNTQQSAQLSPAMRNALAQQQRASGIIPPLRDVNNPGLWASALQDRRGV